MGWGSWAILFLIFLLVTPAAQLGIAEQRRRAARRRFEQLHGCRVLPLFLSMGTVATYGLPLTRFEELPLPQEVADGIAATPVAVMLYLVADLPAGVAFDADPVVAALSARCGPSVLVVPRQALTAGLALGRAADEILLGAGAMVGDGHERADAQGLRDVGLRVREELPDGLDDILAAYPEPHRPRRRPPFYLALPRSARPAHVDQGVVADGVAPDDGPPRAADGA